MMAMPAPIVPPAPQTPTLLIVWLNSRLRLRRRPAGTPSSSHGGGHFRPLSEPIRDRGRECALRPFANEDADMAARKGDLGVVLGPDHLPERHRADRRRDHVVF